MNISHVVNNLAMSGTTLFGVAAMDAKQFNPLYIFFHLAIIITTAIVIGFKAEQAFDNLKKYIHDRLGQRHV